MFLWAFSEAKKYVFSAKYIFSQDYTGYKKIPFKTIIEEQDELSGGSQTDPKKHSFIDFVTIFYNVLKQR